jgi:hypothetical protein
MAAAYVPDLKRKKIKEKGVDERESSRRKKEEDVNAFSHGHRGEEDEIFFFFVPFI